VKNASVAIASAIWHETVMKQRTAVTGAESQAILQKSVKNRNVKTVAGEGAAEMQAAVEDAIFAAVLGISLANAHVSKEWTAAVAAAAAVEAEAAAAVVNRATTAVDQGTLHANALAAAATERNVTHVGNSDMCLVNVPKEI